MKNKKYYFLLTLTLLIGLIIRVYFSLNHPFWLDEKYSIFFATQFKSSELLVNFSQDVHPGLYYLIIKLLLNITNNLFILRLITAVLPQIASIAILAKTLKNRTTALILGGIISINPFLVNLSWQLRSYSLIILIVSLSYLLITKIKENNNRKLLLLLLVTLIVGNMIHYSMYLFSFFSSAYLIHNQKNKLSNKFKLGILFSVSLILITQFLIQNNNIYKYKSQFSEVSWISKPNITNIPIVYLSSFGFLPTKQLYNSSEIYSLISMYILLISIIIFIKKNIFKEKTIFILLFLIPYISILVTSIIVPFLSQKILIHNFIPNISIFLPRMHLPFTIIFWILVSKILTKKYKISNKNIYFILLIGIIIYWSYVNFINFSETNKQTLKNQINLNKIIENNNIKEKQIIFWPHWILVETVDLNNLDQIQKIKSLKETSKNLEEKSFIKNKLILNNYQIFTYKELSINYNLIKKSCEIEDSIDNFKKWNCSNF